MKEYEEYVKGVKKRAADRGREISEWEEAQLFNRWFLHDGAGAHQVDRAMKRQFKTVPDELIKYYANPAAAIDSWAHSMARERAIVKLFGTDGYKAGSAKLASDGVFNEEEAIKQFTNGSGMDLVKDLDPDAQREILGLLKLRLGNGLVNTGKAVKYYKGFVNVTLLGNPFSAAIQLGDIPMSSYRFSVKDSVRGLVRSLKKDAVKVTREDLGLEKMFLEFEDVQGTPMEFLQEFMFKYSGFTAADRIGKNTLLNTALESYSRGAGDMGSKAYKKLARRYQKAWGSQFDDMVADFKKFGETGRKEDITDNIRTVLFTELANVQPITLSEMPESVLRGDGFKFFWTLKSFMLKQADVVRNDMYNEVKVAVTKGDEKALARAVGNMSKFALTVGMGNLGVQNLRDWISNKKDLEDMIDTEEGNLIASTLGAAALHSLKLLSIDEYLLRDIERNGLGAGLFLTLFPPLPIIDPAVQGRIESMPIPGVGSYSRLEGALEQTGLKEEQSNDTAGFAEGGLVKPIEERIEVEKFLNDVYQDDEGNLFVMGEDGSFKEFNPVEEDKSENKESSE